MAFCAECETRKHIWQVQSLMLYIATELIKRALNHDLSKLEEPEKQLFERYTSKLRETEYGSKKYYEYLEKLKPALEHHYKNNSHHPEYYENGIEGMSLLDLIEMLCDWQAATKRHKDGDILKSIDLNQKRFGYSDELKKILMNTVLNELQFEDLEVSHG